MTNRFAILSVFLAVTSTSFGVDRFETPTAIINGTVHDGAGRTIEDGVVLIDEDGIITAVGENIDLPPVVRTIDASGMHVYPGFVDAHSFLGIPDRQRSDEERKRLEDEDPDPTQGPLPEIQQANRRGIRPQVRALDLYAPSIEKIEAHHRRGFATVAAAPRPGIFAGVSAVINVTDDPIRRSILLSDFAQHVGFDSGEPGGYPRTLLGVIAQMRQFVSDVHWRQEMAEYLKRHPNSPRRLPVDPALDAMGAVVSGALPVVMEANTEVEIRRALQLAEEFGFRVWISGGREAFEVADLLAEKKIPVLVSLKFPKKPDDPDKKPASKASTQPDDESSTQPVDEEFKGPYESLKVRREKLRLWHEKVDNLKALNEAGVVTAITSNQNEDLDELLKNLRTAIERGLTPDAALASLSANPARIFGLEKELGSLAAGKLANVCVMTEPLESKKAKVNWMFVNGKSFEYKVDEKKKGDADDKGKDDKSDNDTDDDAPTTASAPTTQAEDLPEWRSEIEADRMPKTRTGGDVLVRGGTVMTISGETIDRGAVLVRDGKIAAVGKDLAAPPGMTVIDANGGYILPGLIDCHSHMAIDAINESSVAISAEVRERDVINHKQVAIYRALAGGVTTIHTMHGSANPIGGQNVVLKLRYRQPPETMIVESAPPTIKFALGENVTQTNRDQARGQRYPNTRMGVESVLRQALATAEQYRREKQAREQAAAGGRAAPPYRKDYRLEALAGVLTGDVWVHCHGYRADEYLRLLAVAEDFGFRVGVLQHILEGYRIAPEIARHGCGASTFSNDWAYKLEAYSAAPHNAAFMARRGINVTLNSDSPNTIRFMNVEAGKAVRWGGLDEIDALKLVTLNAAQQLGIESFVGAIEVGKDADLAIFNGHPLDSFTKCIMTLIEGEVVFEHPDPVRVAATIARINPAPQQIQSVPQVENALYAIVNGAVHPVSGPPIEKGTVLIRDGRIDAVGADLAVPAGATVIDATGAHVWPGLIDAGGVMGLAEIQMLRQTRDSSEIARLSPELRAASAVNPFSEHVRVSRTAGLTTTVTGPDRGWISGRSAVIHLDGWTIDEMLHANDFALHMNVPSLPIDLPEDQKRRKERTEQHDKDIKALEEFIEHAKRYARSVEWAAGDPSKTPPRDLRLEAMIPYLNGDAPVVFDASGYKSILDTLAFAEKHGLKCIISGGAEAWKCADLLAEKNVPVILSTVISYPSSDFEPFDSVFGCAAALDKAGVRYCFASASAAEAFNLPIHVGMAVAHGLDPDKAMRAVTLGAAEILGVDRDLGSLQKGKLANVIVTSDWPIQVTAGVTHMFIRGRPVELSSVQTENIQRFERRPDPVLPPLPPLAGPPSLTVSR